MLPLVIIGRGFLHEQCHLLILMIVIYYFINLVMPLILTASTSFISLTDSLKLVCHNDLFKFENGLP